MRTIAGLLMVLGLALTARAMASDDADARAEAAASDPPVVEVFSAPWPVSQDPPRFPRGEQFAGNEGWVQVNFMVDTTGQPYEIAVVDSTGIEAFERAAVEAVQGWRFNPAQRGGVPLDAGVTRKIQFQFSTPSTGAREQFVKSYKRLASAIEGYDRTAADRYLARLEVTNLYEDAYLGMARYLYAAQWGTRAERIAGLRRAIADEDADRYLPRKQHAAALRALLALELETNDFAAAYLTLQRIQRGEVADHERPGFQRIAATIEAIQSDDSRFVHEGEFGPTSSWFLWLLKNRFRIVVDAGAIAEIKLRCDRRYVMFRYDPELEYTVEDKDGLCRMELIGDPGTRFRLIQS